MEDNNIKNTIENRVPIWIKLNLTIKEAAQYSGIGENRLRELVDDPECTFVLQIGNKKKLIKRTAFEKYLSTLNYL